MTHAEPEAAADQVAVPAAGVPIPEQAAAEAPTDEPDAEPVEPDAEPVEPDAAPEEAEEEPAPDAAELARARFVEMVEERVRRHRYSHALTRCVYTPEEQLIRNVVDRRAAVWVPTFTFLATVGSAVAAVALATRLHSDPIDDYGTGFFIVLGAVVLLAACFVTLFRSELYFDRLRPHGRRVRTDVADAYDTIRNAPHVFVELGAGRDVLLRVTGLQPTAEKLVDALVEYAGGGGTLMRAHPAYERIIRMRAEVEVLALLLEEARAAADDAPRRVLRDPMAPLPRPDQVADYESLDDIAVFIEQA